MKKKYNLNIKNNEGAVRKIDGVYKLTEKAFEVVLTDNYWVGYSKGYYVSDEDKKLLNIDFKNKEKFIIQDKILYRYPKLNLPRQKVDLLKEKYNVKVSRDLEKADAHIISENLINSMFTKAWHKSSTMIEFHSFVQDLKHKDFLTECAIKKINKIFSEIPNDSMLHANVNYYQSDSVHAALLETVDNSMDVHMKAKEWNENNKDLLIIAKYSEDYINIINNTKKIIYDTDVTNIIDNELAIIENDQFDTIYKMVTSSDKDSRSLALEMLANCNIDKSFDIVSHIFYWEYEWLKSTTNWSTINVKALRNRMNQYQGAVHLSAIWTYNNYINLLISDNKLTKFALDKTREKLYNHVLGNLVGSSADVFHIPLDSLVIRNSLKEKIINHD